MADVRSSLGVALVLRTLSCTGCSPTEPTAAPEADHFQSIVGCRRAPRRLQRRVRDTSVAKVRRKAFVPGD